MVNSRVLGALGNEEQVFIFYYVTDGERYSLQIVTIAELEHLC
jgi:hypothetical protein